MFRLRFIDRVFLRIYFKIIKISASIISRERERCATEMAIAENWFQLNWSFRCDSNGIAIMDKLTKKVEKRKENNKCILCIAVVIISNVWSDSIPNTSFDLSLSFNGKSGASINECVPYNVSMNIVMWVSECVCVFCVYLQIDTHTHYFYRFIRNPCVSWQKRCTAQKQQPFKKWRSPP